MNKILIIGLVLLAFSISASDVLSVPQENQSHSELREAISLLHYQKTIHVETTNQGKVVGKFLRVKSDSLYLNYKYDLILIPLADIQSIKTKHSISGSLAMGGGVVGALTGYASAEPLRELGGNNAISILTAFVGGVVGAGLGAIIGKASETYEVIYLRSDSEEGSVISSEFGAGNRNDIKFDIVPDSKGGLFLSASLSF